MLFKHFTEEIIPALADLGGGSGTGALYMDDNRWPDKYNDVVMSADWGRGYLYLDYVTPDKGTFTLNQKKFIKIPQITGVDVDASGTLYMAAWDGAGFKGDSTKGFIVRAVPDGLQPNHFPSLQNASIKKLSKYLKSGSAKARLYAQYELLRRSDEKKAGDAAWDIAENKQLPLDVRVAGLFTYAQIAGKNGITNLVKLTHEKSMREFALRALADREPYIGQVPIKPFISALNSSSDRVKIAAIIGLGRLGRKEAVQPLLKITVPPSFKAPKFGTIGPHATPNPDIIPAHVAVQSLLEIGDTDALLDAVEKNHNKLALWALRYVHELKVPKRLIMMYKKSNNSKFKHRILHNLARIYHKETPYDGSWWWHTRPDTHGPYYKAVDWKGTPAIRKFLISQWQQDSASDKKLFATLNSKYRLDINKFGGVKKEKPEEETSRVISKTPQANNNETGNEVGQIGQSSTKDVLAAIDKISGKVKQGKKLFMKLGCHACHNISNSNVKKGPFLGQIGAIMNRKQIAKAILKPNNTIAQGFVTQLIKTSDGKSYTGFISKETADKLILRNGLGKPTTIKKSTIVTREGQNFSMMPKGLASKLSFKEFASLVDFLSKNKK